MELFYSGMSKPVLVGLRMEQKGWVPGPLTNIARTILVSDVGSFGFGDVL